MTSNVAGPTAGGPLGIAGLLDARLVFDTFRANMSKKF